MNPHRISCISIHKDEFFSAASNVGFLCRVLKSKSFEDACFLFSVFRLDRKKHDKTLISRHEKCYELNSLGAYLTFFEELSHWCINFLDSCKEGGQRVTCQPFSASRVLTFVLTLALWLILKIVF